MRKAKLEAQKKRALAEKQYKDKQIAKKAKRLANKEVKNVSQTN